MFWLSVLGKLAVPPHPHTHTGKILEAPVVKALDLFLTYILRFINLKLFVLVI
jgi:hypothetical protein